jgi:putative ATP-binding cassette transporter
LFILLRPFKFIVAGSIVLDMVGGLSIPLLLATSNDALHTEDGLFSGLCLLALSCSILSDIGTSRVGQSLSASR